VEINKTCNLVLSTLFNYDFSACAYNILKSIGWNLEGVDFQNKERRNIQIGLLQRDNPRLSTFLLDSITNLVDRYLMINNISRDDDLIVRARDGFIVTKDLKILDQSMPIDLRNTISKMIISSDRKKYLAINTDGSIDVKGIRNKTVDISFYSLFRNLEFTTKRKLLIGVEMMRQSVLDSNNVMWFTIFDGDAYQIPIIGSGILKLNRASLKLIEPEEIDKLFLWEEYIWPFARSILIHCHA